MTRSPTLGFFISAHGLGHAARATALINALHRQRPELRFVLFTAAPEWFLRDSLSTPFLLVPASVDVGMVQASATEEDLGGTVRALGGLYPPSQKVLDDFGRLLVDNGCDAVVADIAPLGIAAGRRVGLPTALVENFTWDWIYAGYVAACPAFGPYVEHLAELRQEVDLHIQTTPVCKPERGALHVGALARRPRQGRDATRLALGVRPQQRLVMVSMGGVGARFDFAERLAGRPERFLLVGDAPGLWPKNVITLPPRSGHHHADLVMAADVMVGKLGYSTVAEAWRAGVDWLWIDRPAFRESAVLAAHVRRHHRTRRLSPGALASGVWVEELGRLSGPRPPISFADGSPAAAAAVLRLL